MPRSFGSWLSGPEVSLRELRDPQGWQGKDLGLPREGHGSLAPFGARAAAFFLDIMASSLAGAFLISFVHDPSGLQRQAAGFAVLAVEHVLLVWLSGQTLGMRVIGLRVVALSDQGPPGLVRAVARTLPLLASLGLTGFLTRDGRGLHDLAARSLVVRG